MKNFVKGEKVKVFSGTSDAFGSITISDSDYVNTPTGKSEEIVQVAGHVGWYYASSVERFTSLKEELPNIFEGRVKQPIKVVGE